MRALISTHLIQKLRPHTSPFEIRDERVKGFLLRVQPSGSMTYYVEYKRGKRVRIGPASAFEPNKARTEAKKILYAHHKGEDVRKALRNDEALTLAGFIDEVYEPWASVHLKTGKATCARMRHSFSDLLKELVLNLSPRDVENWRTKRIEAGRSTATVNRDLNALKAAMTRAVAWGYVDKNSLSAVKPIRVDTISRCRFLDDSELTNLRTAMDERERELRAARRSGNEWRRARSTKELPNLDEVPFADYLKPMVLISVNTGLRRGELFALTWEKVDLEGRNITVTGATAKSGKTRHIPLNSEVLDVLRDWQKQSNCKTGLVFKGRKGGKFDNVGRSWATVLEHAEISDFRWHDLRHTFASRLVMAGVDLNTVRELLGHSDYQMTLRYAHLAPAHKISAVEKLVA